VKAKQIPGPLSKKWLKRLEKVESPDVTFQGERFPVVLDKGRGMRVRDADGNSYLDFTACFGVHALGHGAAPILRALRSQSARLLHGMGDVHPSCSKVRLLEELARCTPFQKAQAVLSLSGGEAIESALKTAILATGRNRFASFQGGYHGLHLGPLSLNDRKTFTAGFESWIGRNNVILPFPYYADCFDTHPEKRTVAQEKKFLEPHGMAHAQECLEILEKELSSRTIAALVLEPLQGRGGERVWPKEFVSSVSQICKETGTLLIFDEIYTGFGRTGPLFAGEWHLVVPDILCLGKALGGGLPLSACVAESDLFAVWGKSQGESRHTSTFLGHPLACATGLAAIQEIQKKLPEFQKNQEKVHQLSLDFAKNHARKNQNKEWQFQIRGRGAMWGFWFYNGKPGCAAWLSEELLQEGFLVLPSGPRGDVLSMTPPLIAKQKDYELLFQRLELILSRATS
jgi:4-aminobutyrate aminotransferase-like enzyme